MNLETIGRTIMVIAVFLFLFGLIFFMGRTGITRLPGDIIFKRGNIHLSFPIVTSIIVSIILTILLNVVIYFSRR